MRNGLLAYSLDFIVSSELCETAPTRMPRDMCIIIQYCTQSVSIQLSSRMRHMQLKK